MTLPFSSEPIVPCLGGDAISMPLSSTASGVGGSLPNPESGSVQESAIETKPLTPTLAFLVAQVGEKFVAQSVLPSKCPSTLYWLRASGPDPLGARVYSSPASKAPRVYRISLPSGDQTQFSSPVAPSSANLAGPPLPSTGIVKRSDKLFCCPRRKQSRPPSGDTAACQASFAGSS